MGKEAALPFTAQSQISIAGRLCPSLSQEAPELPAGTPHFHWLSNHWITSEVTPGKAAIPSKSTRKPILKDQTQGLLCLNMIYTSDHVTFTVLPSI